MLTQIYYQETLQLYFKFVELTTLVIFYTLIHSLAALTYIQWKSKSYIQHRKLYHLTKYRKTISQINIKPVPFDNFSHRTFSEVENKVLSSAPKFVFRKKD